METVPRTRKLESRGRLAFLAGVFLLAVPGLCRWIADASHTGADGSAPGMASIAPPGCLRPGDLVFRRGRSVVSHVVLFLDDRAPYSHVGMVARIDGKTVIVHSVPDEPAGSPGSVRADTAAVFLGADRAVAVAVYRPAAEFQDAAARAAGIAVGYARRHVPFDADFDLDTPDKVYCTELIWRAYREAGLELVEGDLPIINLGLRKRRAILPSTLQSSGRLVRIWSGATE